MELALFIRRVISLAAMSLLLAALTGCSEQPSARPPSSDRTKKETTPPSQTGIAESTPNSVEKSTAENAGKSDTPATSASATLSKNDQPQAQGTEDTSIQEFLQPTNPNAIFSNSDSKAATDTKESHKAKSEVTVAENNEDDKPKTDEEIAAESAARRKAALKEIVDKLGPPLVENVDKLTRLDPLYPVWVDKENKRVVLGGVICQSNAPLEMFAVPSGTKEHEAIVAVPTEAHLVHAALIVVGAKPGNPVAFGPKPSDYKPATGTEIEITVKWKNDKGEIQSARAQEWIKNVKTGKDMQESWVFGGSGFWKDEQTGIEYYKAEGGDFICVSNFPSAMLDLPVESSQSNDELMFQANSERIPPRNTAVTLVLTPKQKSD